MVTLCSIPCCVLADAGPQLMDRTFADGLPEASYLRRLSHEAKLLQHASQWAELGIPQLLGAAACPLHLAIPGGAARPLWRQLSFDILMVLILLFRSRSRFVAICFPPTLLSCCPPVAVSSWCVPFFSPQPLAPHFCCLLLSPPVSSCLLLWCFFKPLVET